MADRPPGRRRPGNRPGLVALGIPADGPQPSGAAWVREVIPGDALCLGFGYGPSSPSPAIATGRLEHAGIDADARPGNGFAPNSNGWGPAAERERRQLRRAIVPFGGADVVTLLGSASLRRELVAQRGRRRHDRPDRPARARADGGRATSVIQRSGPRSRLPCRRWSADSPAPFSSPQRRSARSGPAETRRACCATRTESGLCALRVERRLEPRDRFRHPAGDGLRDRPASPIT